MKYAVIQTGGKQYKVTEGDVLHVERIAADTNTSVTFSDVLLLIDGDTVKVGTPFVSGLSVTATVVNHPRGEKIRVAKFKAKSRYRRVMGHRQSLSTIKIDAIGEKAKAAKAEKVETVPTEEKPVKKTRAAKKA